MNRTIKRTITITITETWTIVWTSADEPPATAGQAPNSEEGTQATQNNAILDSLPKEQRPENDPPVPQVLNQKPGRQRAPPTRRRRKQ